MHAHGKNRHGDLVPMAAAAAVAVVGIAALVLMEVGLKDVQRDSISMITTAVVDRAGATALPSDPKLQPAIQNRSTLSGSSIP
jgi:hypothetical protein